MLLAYCYCYCLHKPGPIAGNAIALPNTHGKKASQRAASGSLWVFREDPLIYFFGFMKPAKTQQAFTWGHIPEKPPPRSKVGTRMLASLLVGSQVDELKDTSKGKGRNGWDWWHKATHIRSKKCGGRRGAGSGGPAGLSPERWLSDRWL